jgi:retron-type reverse transcriptase
MTKCILFQKNTVLVLHAYRVQSPVSPSIFRDFISALEENAINITYRNFAELKRLCEEFGFAAIEVRLSDFLPLMDFKEVENADARKRIAAMEKQAENNERSIVILRDKVTQLSTHLRPLGEEVLAV